MCAIDALSKQPTLPVNILQALTIVLSNGTCPEAVSVLLKQDYLYNSLLNFDVKTLRSLYKILVRQSFDGQLSCYRWDGTLYIDMPDRRRRISSVLKKDNFLNVSWRRKISLVLNKDAFLSTFHDEALALGRPTSSADGLELTLTPWLWNIYLLVICFFALVLVSTQKEGLRWLANLFL